LAISFARFFSVLVKNAAAFSFLQACEKQFKGERHAASATSRIGILPNGKRSPTSFL